MSFDEGVFYVFVTIGVNTACIFFAINLKFQVKREEMVPTRKQVVWSKKEMLDRLRLGESSLYPDKGFYASTSP